jgi:hypothetical protein
MTGLVQRIDRALEDPGARIDDVGLAAVPAGIAQSQFTQVSKDLRNLEAHAVQGHGTVAAPLGALNLDTKVTTQGLGVRAVA